MEIWTMLKANIKHKKGTFISIVIMMILISMSLTAIISVSDNADKSVEKAYEQVNAGELTFFIKEKDLSQKLLDSVKNHNTVDTVKSYEAVCSEMVEVNGNENGNSWFLQKLRNEYRIQDKDLSGYAEETPDLKKGEIYVPQGIITELKCNIGDTVKITTISGTYRFKIKGAVAPTWSCDSPSPFTDTAAF